MPQPVSGFRAAARIERHAMEQHAVSLGVGGHEGIIIAFHAGQRLFSVSLTLLLGAALPLYADDWPQ